MTTVRIESITSTIRELRAGIKSETKALAAVLVKRIEPLRCANALAIVDFPDAGGP